VAKKQQKRRSGARRPPQRSTSSWNRRSAADRALERAVRRVRRRLWPTLVTIVFMVLALAYVFRWGPVVRHHPSLWVSPVDLATTYAAASAFVHGHFSDVYGRGYLSAPGFLVLLAPVAALSGRLNIGLVRISAVGHHLVSHPSGLLLHSSQTLRTDFEVPIRGQHYLLHPEALVLLLPYVLALSAVALFACDALAEHLGVSEPRRAVLSVAEGVLLWNVVVFWGHPEYAVSLGLLLYSLLFVLEGRWTGAGWLFGVALALQTMVVVVFPLILFMGGTRRLARLLVAGLVPTAVVALPTLAANFHGTYQALVTQPAFPGLNHQTPWTSLAPTIKGKGRLLEVGGGPFRLAAIALAVPIGWLARRWRDEAQLVVWAAAVALALRCYFESAATAYYIWPALAVALVVAARRSAAWFGATVAVAVFTTVVAQWHLALWPWWLIDVAGLTAVLVLAAGPALLGTGWASATGSATEEVPPERPVRPSRVRA